MSDDIPDPWRSAAEAKAISPTYRPLAAKAGLSHETVRKIIQGRATSSASIRKLAAALGVSAETVHEWRDEAPPDYGKVFSPDPAASLLTTEEREAVNGIIRLLTRSRIEHREEVGSRGDSTATKKAGQQPAPELTRDDVARAARNFPPDGGQLQRLDREAARAGEGNQDDGGDEPA